MENLLIIYLIFKACMVKYFTLHYINFIYTHIMMKRMVSILIKLRYFYKRFFLWLIEYFCVT